MTRIHLTEVRVVAFERGAALTGLAAGRNGTTLSNTGKIAAPKEGAAFGKKGAVKSTISAAKRKKIEWALVEKVYTNRQIVV